MAEQQHGVKETKELLTGIFVIAKVLGAELKDGFQIADLVAAFNAIQADPIKKAQLEAALKEVKMVPDEVKEISLSESLELVVHVIGELPSVIEAFKKKA